MSAGPKILATAIHALAVVIAHQKPETIESAVRLVLDELCSDVARKARTVTDEIRRAGELEESARKVDEAHASGKTIGGFPLVDDDTKGIAPPTSPTSRRRKK